MNPFSSSAIRISLFVAIAATPFLSACSTEAAPAAMNDPEVQVALPVVQTVTASQGYPALLEAIDRVALHAQVSGYLERIEFKEGALVRQGDVLFRIDSRAYEAKLADAQAALMIARAEAHLAQTEFERASRLLERQAISIEEAQRREALAEVAKARVLAAEAAVKTAKLDVEFSVIRAPFTGRIGRAAMTVGNLVSPSDELAVLVALDEMHVRFDVDENSFSRLHPELSSGWFVNFTLPGANKPAVSGPVQIIANEMERGTGTIRIHARIRNEEHALLPGMFGEAELVTGVRQDALLIDEKALGINQGQRFVLVANADNVLEFRPVTAGPRHGDLREIQSGLTPADRVVINGLMRVRPGASITPIEVPMSAVATALLPSRVRAGS